MPEPRDINDRELHETAVSWKRLCINMDSVTGNPFWRAIGHGGLKEGQVINKLVEAYDKENKKRPHR